MQWPDSVKVINVSIGQDQPCGGAARPAPLPRRGGRRCGRSDGRRVRTGNEHVRAAGNHEHLQRQRHLGRRLPHGRPAAEEDHRVLAQAAVEPVGHLLPAGRADDPADLEILRPRQMGLRLPAQTAGPGRRAHRPGRGLEELRGQGLGPRRVPGRLLLPRHGVRHPAVRVVLRALLQQAGVQEAGPVRPGELGRAPALRRGPQTQQDHAVPRQPGGRLARHRVVPGAGQQDRSALLPAAGGRAGLLHRRAGPPGDGPLAGLHAQGLDDAPDFDQARGPGALKEGTLGMFLHGTWQAAGMARRA